jgi:hypothetical protein
MLYCHQLTIGSGFVGKRVNKRPRNDLGLLCWFWPQSEAIELAVRWSNLPHFETVDRVVSALDTCDDVLREFGQRNNPRRSFEKSVRQETETVRRWLQAAVDAKDPRRPLPHAVIGEINESLDRLQTSVRPLYKVHKGFGHYRGLTEQFGEFKPLPISWAALGVSLVASDKGKWSPRVGKCLYHTERFMFNTIRDGERGPLRSFYCASGCKVMASRARARAKQQLL